MADEQQKKESEATPNGAAEVDEKNLDQAAGGGTEPSIYFAKRTLEGTSREDPAAPSEAAGPPHVAPEPRG